MILVDSSVWIDYLSHRVSVVERALEALIQPANQVLVAGIIQQEVLQGIRNQKSYELTRRLLKPFPSLEPDLTVYHKAAEYYRYLKASGHSTTSIDALLAAMAIHYRAPLYTLDRGFQNYIPFGLKLYSA